MGIVIPTTSLVTVKIKEDNAYKVLKPGLEDTTGARGAGPGRPAGVGGRGPEWLQVRKRGPQVSSGQRVSEGSRGEGNAAFSSAGIFFFF